MPEPKTFTQEEFDAKLTEATNGVRAELTTVREERRKFESDLKAVQAELEKQKAEREKADSAKEKTELLAQGKYEEALKKYQEETQAVIEKKDKAIAELKSTVTKFRVDNQIMAAAGDAINPEQVTTLLKAGYEFVEKTDGTIDILNATTKSPVLDKNSGKPVDLKGLTESFLGENKHLVKPGIQTGGTGTQRGSGNSYKAGDGDIVAQIEAAQKAGNSALVIKLKAQQMSLQGPHSLRTAGKSGG